MIEIVYDKKTAENQSKSMKPYNIPKNIQADRECTLKEKDIHRRLRYDIFKKNCRTGKYCFQGCHTFR